MLFIRIIGTASYKGLFCVIVNSPLVVHLLVWKWLVTSLLKLNVDASFKSKGEKDVVGLCEGMMVRSWTMGLNFRYFTYCSYG